MSRLILFFIVILLYNLYNCQKYSEQKKKKYFLMMVGTCFVLESALRHMCVGPDTYQYYQIFEQVKNTSFTQILESREGVGGYIKDPFYWVFQKTFQLFFPKYRLFLFFVAILFFSSFNRFLLKNGLSLRDMVISYLFYLGMFHAFYSYTGIRQTIAVAFIFHSCIYLFRGSYIKSFIPFIIAFLFHSSAIVFILAYVMLFVKSPKIFIPVILGAMLAFLVFREMIMLYMLYTSGLENRFEKFATAETEGAGSISVTIMYVGFFALLLLLYKRIMLNNRLFNYFKFYCFVVSCLPIMFADNSAFRISMYYSVSMFVLVPFVVSQIKIRNKYTIVYFLFFALLCISALRTPYYFYWQLAPLIEYGFSLSEPLL